MGHLHGQLRRCSQLEVSRLHHQLQNSVLRLSLCHIGQGHEGNLREIVGDKVRLKLFGLDASLKKSLGGLLQISDDLLEVLLKGDLLVANLHAANSVIE